MKRRLSSRLLLLVSLVAAASGCGVQKESSENDGQHSQVERLQVVSKKNLGFDPGPVLKLLAKAVKGRIGTTALRGERYVFKLVKVLDEAELVYGGEMVFVENRLSSVLKWAAGRFTKELQNGWKIRVFRLP